MIGSIIFETNDLYIEESKKLTHSSTKETEHSSMTDVKAIRILFVDLLMSGI